MKADSGHISDQQILAVLECTSPHEAELQTELHLERCNRCQSRLTQMSAANNTWAELKFLLQPTAQDLESESIVRERLDSCEKSERPEIKIDHLLSPALHPELLGRLGRYDIERKIGAGGMGLVLKGFDSELNRPVAIKILVSHLAHHGAARQRFAREARAAAAVVNEHVVAIYNVESDSDTPYLVMNYVDGESLQERVDRLGPLPAEQILQIGMQIAVGLDAAHQQGVIHRDIKPANILVEHGVDRVMISDFGLARIVDDASLTQTGVITGTPHYMSPEQTVGDIADMASDLFSLGSVLYFMSTGHPPFRASNPMAVMNRIQKDRQRPVWKINHQIPLELSKLIDRLLAKKPSRRISSADEVRRLLSDLLSAQRNNVQIRTTKRKTMMTAMIASLITALCLLGPVAWNLSTDPDEDSNVAQSNASKKPRNSPPPVTPDQRAKHERNENRAQSTPSSKKDKRTLAIDRIKQVGGKFRNFHPLDHPDHWIQIILETKRQRADVFLSDELPTDSPFDDSIMAALRFLAQSSPTNLHLRDTSITSDGILKLRETKVRRLALQGRNINRQTLENLKHLPDLAILDIHSPTIVDNDLACLTDCNRLENLGITGTQLTHKAVAQIAKLEKLKSLTLGAEFGDETANSINQLTKLESLETSDSFTSKFFRRLNQLPTLKKLSISGDNIDDECIQFLSKKAVKLEQLYVRNANITNDALKHVAKLTNLEVVCFDRCAISDVGVKHLEEMPNIRWLDLTDTKVTDQCLKVVGKMKTMRSIFLMNTQVSDNGLHHLSKLQSLRHISLSGTKVTKVPDWMANQPKLYVSID